MAQKFLYTVAGKAIKLKSVNFYYYAAKIPVALIP